MPLSSQEYQAIINDDTKRICGDISWEGRFDAPAREFRVDVESEANHSISIKGWYNPPSGKLSYALVHRIVGRIHGLDLGAEHSNPDGQTVGEKHKNYWVSGSRDKWAYVPDDITETWDRPVAVWQQFCAEINLEHGGTLREPGAVQGAQLI
jgi:hypothetical protein